MGEEESQASDSGAMQTAAKEKIRRLKTWQEMGIQQPFKKILLEEKAVFSFQKINYHEYSGILRYPVVVPSFRRGPLYIIEDHHHLIDVLEDAGISGPIGSIQFDQHRDLAATAEYLPTNKFEAAFNAELIRRGIFHPDTMIIGLPFSGLLLDS